MKYIFGIFHSPFNFKAFNTNLHYVAIDGEAFLKDRQAELGEFMGTVIAGIYKGIHDGGFDVPSHFEKVMKRKHYSLEQMIEEFRNTR